MNFDVECEWHFFTTSHGKSASDGIGGVVKRMIVKASLHRPFEIKYQLLRTCTHFAKKILEIKLVFLYF